MAGDLEGIDPDLLNFMIILDKDHEISNGSKKWIVIWNQPNISLNSNFNASMQRLVELAHSDESVLIKSTDFENVERSLNQLVEAAYLSAEGIGIFRIDERLVSTLRSLPPIDP